MQITELVQKFLAACVETKLAADTVRFYDSRLKAFVDKFGDRELQDLTREEIIEHLAAVTAAGKGRSGNGLSESTQRHNAVSIQVLFEFAKIPFEKLDKPPMGERDRLPTLEETAAILTGAPFPFALIYTALRISGARPGELCRATVADFNRQKKVITLKEHKTARKTKKDRKIAVGEDMLQLITLALEAHSPTGPRTSGPIFLTENGHPWRVQHLSRMYRNRRNKAGLPNDLVLYLARHECASKACKELGVGAAQVMLGHADPKTTMKYVHYSTHEVAGLQDRLKVAALPPRPPKAPADPGKAA